MKFGGLSVHPSGTATLDLGISGTTVMRQVQCSQKARGAPCWGERVFGIGVKVGETSQGPGAEPRGGSSRLHQGSEH